MRNMPVLIEEVTTEVLPEREQTLEAAPGEALTALEPDAFEMAATLELIEQRRARLSYD